MISYASHRILTQCCNHKKFNRLFFSSVPSLSGVRAWIYTLWIMTIAPLVSKDKRSTVYFWKDQRERYDLCVLAEAKSYVPSCSFPPLLICFPPLLPFIHICPSPAFPYSSFPSLFAWSQATPEIYRSWRDASGGQMHERLTVCLSYHSLWLM